jgi:hypothetical protein
VLIIVTEVLTSIITIMLRDCGVSNVLQFSIRNNKQIWFTEWSENKIGKLYADKKLPFSIMTSQKELTVKRGESAKINLKIKSIAATSDENRDSYYQSHLFLLLTIYVQ